MRTSLPSGTAAELVRPADCTVDRALVVIPDVGGLRPLFDDMVADLSSRTGWPVCAFELWAGREGTEVAWRLDNVGVLDDQRVLGDAAEAADLTGAEKVSIIGFCMGGMFTLKAAGTGRFWRAAAFYGMVKLPERWHSPTQGEPLDYLASPDRCPTMAVMAMADPLIPNEDSELLEAAGVEVARYEGADHGFVHDPSRPAHRPADAADAWDRVIDFLSR